MLDFEPYVNQFILALHIH